MGVAEGKPPAVPGGWYAVQIRADSMFDPHEMNAHRTHALHQPYLLQARYALYSKLVSSTVTRRRSAYGNKPIRVPYTLAAMYHVHLDARSTIRSYAYAHVSRFGNLRTSRARNRIAFTNRIENR